MMMSGADLKTWRQTVGWTQSQLMDELDISSRQTIVNWEKSDWVPRIVELAVIAVDQVEACRATGGIEKTFDVEEIRRRKHHYDRFARQITD